MTERLVDVVGSNNVALHTFPITLGTRADPLCRRMLTTKGKH